MSGSDDGKWTMAVVREGTGTVPLRVSVHGRNVHMTIGNGGVRPVVLELRQLAELIEDLRAAGRYVKAADYGAQLCAEYATPGWWASIFPNGDVADVEAEQAQMPPPAGEVVVDVDGRTPGRARRRRSRLTTPRARDGRQ